MNLRPLTIADLAQANAVVEAAIMAWDLPDRVKRLAVPSYRYQPMDLDHLTIIGAHDSAGRCVGVAAWEPADPDDAPRGMTALLLHGIYVRPELQTRGIGSRLLSAALQAAREGGFDGLLVKANRDAQGFFLAQRFQPLSTTDPDRDYPYRYWANVKPD